MSPSTKAKRPSTNNIDQTLDQLSSQVDAHIGRRTGFASAVREYRINADREKAVGSKSDYRLKLNRMLDLALAGRDEVAVLGERVGRRVTPAKVKRCIPSSAAKKGNPQLWDMARIARPRVTVSCDQVFSVQVPGFVPSAVDQVWGEILRRRAEAARYAAAVDEARKTINETLDACAGVWDGAAVWTADGWKVGRSLIQTYDESRFKQLCEDRGVRWSRYVELVAVPERVQYVSLGEAEEDWEIDEIDGD